MRRFLGGKNKFFICIISFSLVSLLSFSLDRIYRFANFESFSQFPLIYFIGSVLAYFLFTLALVKYLGSLSPVHYEMIPKIRILNWGLIYGNYTTVFLFIFLILQIILYNQYSLRVLELALWIAFVETFLFLGILSFKFVSWSFSAGPRKQSIITWSYAISIIMLLSNSIFTFSVRVTLF